MNRLTSPASKKGGDDVGTRTRACICMALHALFRQYPMTHQAIVIVPTAIVDTEVSTEVDTM